MEGKGKVIMDIQKIISYINNAEWRQHPYLEGVECSELGSVRINGKHLKGCLVNNRKRKATYRVVFIQGKRRLAHRLVYEAFHGAITEGLVIDHINTCPWDNRIENLRAVTTEENNKNPLTVKKLKERKGTPVVRIDNKTGRVEGYYRSIKEAIRKTGSQWVTIKRHLKGEKPKGKYRWEKAKYQYSCKWGKWWISGDL